MRGRSSRATGRRWWLEGLEDNAQGEPKPAERSRESPNRAGYRRDT